MAKRYETPEFDISFTSSRSPEYARSDLLEAAEKRISDLTEELNVTTRQGLIYKNERDQALAASAAREIAMRDRAAEECRNRRQGWLRPYILNIPLSPDGQQALNEMLADAWKEAYAQGLDDFACNNESKNPYEK